MSEHDEKSPRGIQSVEVAAELLEALTLLQKPVSLKEFASAVGMSSARAFPYLVSLVRSGLVFKDEETGLYEPGLVARDLGVLGLHFLSPTHEAEPVVKELAAATGHAVVLSVWGSLGPTVVRMEEARFSLYSEIRLGSVMSLTNSSIGRTFSAWLPQSALQKNLLLEEIRDAGSSTARLDLPSYLEQLSLIRERGVDVQRDRPMPGLSSLSAPVFGLNGEIVFTLTVFDDTNAMNLSVDGDTSLTLQRSTQKLSRQLGHYSIP
ncbi:MAG: IclR family transcriptional regulator C-terminal domain-containing protein [Candidatus Pseudomonas phytovorans]|uniref:IclR family transcriptional regulator C-terminal domain-containing protein n=1 Tax=Candidatus Pseudomonas phytovorans TaxID=3121377 RepID=A0AAJ6B9U1_9PSED|nr:IclR family transcriptional regulator C-terminal domain-containing protein [Pseudomonas sp.]WEK28507.1 MAG: IclR family transcriptional regulator C-terminal domain-containing protein [Pseudomonas sp.]